MYENPQKVQRHQEFGYTDPLLPHKLNESWAGRRLLEALSHLPPSNFSSTLNVSQLT